MLFSWDDTLANRRSEPDTSTYRSRPFGVGQRRLAHAVFLSLLAVSPSAYGDPTALAPLLEGRKLRHSTHQVRIPTKGDLKNLRRWIVDVATPRAAEGNEQAIALLNHPALAYIQSTHPCNVVTTRKAHNGRAALLGKDPQKNAVWAFLNKANRRNKPGDLAQSLQKSAMNVAEYFREAMRWHVTGSEGLTIPARLSDEEGKCHNLELLFAMACGVASEGLTLGLNKDRAIVHRLPSEGDPARRAAFERVAEFNLAAMQSLPFEEVPNHECATIFVPDIKPGEQGLKQLRAAHTSYNEAVDRVVRYAKAAGHKRKSINMPLLDVPHEDFDADLAARRPNIDYQESLTNEISSRLKRRAQAGQLCETAAAAEGAMRVEASYLEEKKKEHREIPWSVRPSWFAGSDMMQRYGLAAHLLRLVARSDMAHLQDSRKFGDLIFLFWAGQSLLGTRSGPGRFPEYYPIFHPGMTCTVPPDVKEADMLAEHIAWMLESKLTDPPRLSEAERHALLVAGVPFVTKHAQLLGDNGHAIQLLVRLFNHNLRARRPESFPPFQAVNGDVMLVPPKDLDGKEAKAAGSYGRVPYLADYANVIGKGADKEPLRRQIVQAQKHLERGYPNGSRAIKASAAAQTGVGWQWDYEGVGHGLEGAYELVGSQHRDLLDRWLLPVAECNVRNNTHKILPLAKDRKLFVHIQKALHPKTPKSTIEDRHADYAANAEALQRHLGASIRDLTDSQSDHDSNIWVPAMENLAKDRTFRQWMKGNVPMAPERHQRLFEDHMLPLAELRGCIG